MTHLKVGKYLYFCIYKHTKNIYDIIKIKKYYECLICT